MSIRAGCGGVSRVKVRDCGWMGIWTGNAYADTNLDGADCDSIFGTHGGVGIYCEHFTKSSTFTNFSLGRDYGDLKIGIACEWNNDILDNAASHDCLFQHGLIRTLNVDGHSPKGRQGISLDKGTRHPAVKYVTFIGMDDCCILDRTGEPQATGPHDSELRTYRNNVAGRAQGCVPIVYG